MTVISNRKRLAYSLLVSSAIALLGLTSCGGGGGDDPAPTGNPATGQPTGGTPTTPPASETPAVPADPPATTTSSFGIPAGLTGTVATGESLFAQTCTGCHASLGARNYPQLAAAMSIPAMSSLNLSQQQLADLTAYLNRASIPAAPTTPPATTDPPVVPPSNPGTTPTVDTTTGFGIPSGFTGSVSAGQGVFTASCAGCHSSLGPRTYTQIDSALAAISAMRSLNLSQQQIADLTAYLNRASIPGSTTTPPTTGTGGGDDDEIDSDDDGGGTGGESEDESEGGDD
jgi:mono/diheme cytochrome c family protein